MASLHRMRWRKGVLNVFWSVDVARTRGYDAGEVALVLRVPFENEAKMQEFLDAHVGKVRAGDLPEA